MKAFIRSLLPEPILEAYHWTLAYLGALLYRSPSKQLTVIAVTGTKGKSSVVELIAAILRADNKKIATANTIRFCIGEVCERNLYKMSTPGRFFLQRFLRRAVDAGCTHAVVELTSEAAKQHRHKGVELDALVFTNLAPEHIESHGSFEKYLDAKLSLARALSSSTKRPRIVVANADDKHGEKFLDIAAEVKAPFSLQDTRSWSADDKSVRFVWRGTLFAVPLPGLFNLQNCLAALTLGHALGVPTETMQKALEHMPPIPGRAQRIEAGQKFDVVVDYAHTPESLTALYETFKHKRIIGVLGSMGGGRDAWKHAKMGELADTYCDVAVLTEEDPYDADPQVLIARTAKGFTRHTPIVVPNRRDAIYKAFTLAKDGDAVLITGKGTDPYIMRARGAKEPWSDATVAKEELARLGFDA